MGLKTLMMVAAMAGAITPGVGQAQADTPHPPTIHDAVSALVTNTLVYSKPDHPGETTAAYLRPDGTGLAATRDGKDMGGVRRIQWAILSDQRLCIANVGRKPWEGDCGTLSVEGEDAVLVPAEGQHWPGKLLQGDAWSLDAPTRKLTGRAAIEALIGNTFLLMPLGGGRPSTAIYLLADGTVRRGADDLDDGGVPEFTNWVLQTPERWSLRESDGSFCISDVEPGTRRPDFCAAVSLAGDTVIFRYGPNHRLLHGKLLQGDARSLSPAASAAVKAMQDTLVGNTLVLANPAEETIVYFRAEGAGRVQRRGGATGDEARPFRWLLRTDGSLCIAEGKAKFHDVDCGVISVVGDAVTLKGPGGSVVSGRILKGNARKL